MLLVIIFLDIFSDIFDVTSLGLFYYLKLTSIKFYHKIMTNFLINNVHRFKLSLQYSESLSSC
jgi:hypothetical protein